MNTVRSKHGSFARSYKSNSFIVILLIIGFTLTGCKNGQEIKLSYKPPIIIPIDIAINSKGEVALEVSQSFVTPIGTFEIEGEQTIHTIRQNNTGRLLLVGLDGRMTVYSLVEGEDFQVEYIGDQSLYRKVTFERHANGDILLELESVKFTTNSDLGYYSTVSEVALCVKTDYDGSKCIATKTLFPSTTEAVYATWQSKDALTARTRFTRRWFKDGRLLLENSNSAGENDRWTPNDGQSYFVYLSAVEGTGKRLFNSSSLPSGSYRLELYANGQLSRKLEFQVQ